MKRYKVIPLGEILDKGYEQQKIEEAFKKFSCHREIDLENFLMNKAIPYQRTGFGKTYLCVDEEALEKNEFIVMAYFTIAQKSLDISNLSKKKKRKVLGEYPGRDNLNSVPAYLIGQFRKLQRFTRLCFDSSSFIYAIVGNNRYYKNCGKPRRQCYDNEQKTEKVRRE